MTPGIRWCENHCRWEYRATDIAGRPVWRILPGAGPDDPDGNALDEAEKVYGVPASEIENYTGREQEAYGLCAPKEG